MPSVVEWTSLMTSRLRMFNDEPVEAQVHSLLAERSDKLASAANVAGVADHGQSGNAPMEFHGNLPLRLVAVDFVLVARESSVDGSQLFHSCPVEPFQGADP